MATASRNRRFVPHLEALDGRAVPSVTVVEGTGADAGVITVYGDQGANTIEVSDTGTADADAITVTVVDDSDVTVDQTFTFDGTATKVVVLGRSGADTVSYDLTGELAGGVSRTVEVRLGNQHDSFDATLAGLAADSSLTLLVHGGNGHDSLSVTQSGAVDGDLDIQLLGQNGKDSVYADVAGNVSGELDLVLNGGNGVDYLWAEVTLDAAPTDPTDPTEPTDPVGDVSVEVLGGNGKDELNLLVDGAGVDGVSASAFTIDGGRGWDNFNYTEDVVTVLDREAK